MWSVHYRSKPTELKRPTFRNLKFSPTPSDWKNLRFQWGKFQTFRGTICEFKNPKTRCRKIQPLQLFIQTVTFTSRHLPYTLEKLRWNRKMQRLEDDVHFSIGWFLGSMLIFRGVDSSPPQPFWWHSKLFALHSRHAAHLTVGPQQISDREIYIQDNRQKKVPSKKSNVMSRVTEEKKTVCMVCIYSP